LPFGEFGDAVDVYQIAHEIIMGYYAQAEGDSGGKLPPRAYPGCIFRGLGPGAGCRHLGGQMANGINRDGQEGTIRALREAVGVPPDQDSRPDRWLWRPEPEIPPGASEIYAALRGPVVP
jgi:hypothetical protein